MGRGGGGGGSDERPRVRRRLAFVDLKTLKLRQTLEEDADWIPPIEQRRREGASVRRQEEAVRL